MSNELIDTSFEDCCAFCKQRLRDAFREQCADHAKSTERLIAKVSALTLDLALRTAERDQIKQSLDRVAAENRGLRGEALL